MAGLVLCDRDGRVERVGRRSAVLTGGLAGLSPGSQLIGVFDAADQVRLREAWVRVLDGDLQVAPVACRLSGAAPVSPVVVSLSALPAGGNGGPAMLVSIDAPADGAGQAGEGRFRELVERSRDVLLRYQVRPERRLVYLNPAVEALTGYTAQELLTDPARRRGLFHPADYERLRDWLISHPGGGASPELPLQHRSGSQVWSEWSFSVRRDDEGHPVELFASIRDVTERRRGLAELGRASLRDPLTGAATRTLLVDRLTDRVHRAGAPVGLVALDLDGFRAVNDGYGHSAGDEVLCGLADRLLRSAEPGDTVSRLGADRFAVLVPVSEEDGGEVDRAAEKLLSACAAPVVLSSGVELPLSLRCAVVTTRDAPAEELIASVEAALRAPAEVAGDRRLGAPAARPRRVGGEAERDPGERRRDPTEYRFTRALADALADGSVAVHYQPVLDLATGEVTGVEALARWPAGGAYREPDRFVPLAEATGLMPALGEWVLGQACRAASRWRRAGGDMARVGVAVNVSATQLRPGFAGWVGEQLAACDLSTQTLTIEITEGVVVGVDPALVAELSQLRRMGVHVSLDDFGTGYSSLLYLRQLPVDEIKIDRRFTAGLTRDRDDEVIVSSVLQLARGVGVSVVAEGIETAEQLDWLAARGCHRGQGWLWSAAVAAELLPGVVSGIARSAPYRRAQTAALQRGSDEAMALTDAGATSSAATLALLVALRQEGASLHTMAAALNSAGHRTPDGLRWHVRSVARVIAGLAP